MNDALAAALHALQHISATGFNLIKGEQKA
ncbi:MAG: hypothetical protein CM15mP74_08640 [Halieaceae bacterium]|nr:MAG: hypothetical protein CM15mP74_08640 [Halieaceae bacterium]